MEKETRPKGRGLKQMLETNALFREKLLQEWESRQKFIDEKAKEITSRMHRIEMGHKQLIEWMGLQYMCYIPKELCLLNLTLMGIPATESTFLKAVRENRFGTPIQKSKKVKEPLYNFNMVFKYFFLYYTETPIKSYNEQIRVHKENKQILERQAIIKAECIKRIDDGKTFVFDADVLKRFREEIYGIKE